MSSVSLPGARSSIVDSSGRVDTVWYNFFEALLRRAGGTGEVTDLTGVISLLADAANNIDELRNESRPAYDDHEVRGLIEELRTELQTVQGLAQDLRTMIEELRNDIPQSRVDELRQRVETIETRLG